MPLFGPNVDKLKAKRDVPGLVKILVDHKDDKLRLAAISALGDIGDQPSVEVLQELFEFGSRIRLTEPIVVAATHEVMKKEDPKTTKLVVARVGNWCYSNPNIEQAVLNELTQNPTPQAVTTLTAALRFRNVNAEHTAAKLHMHAIKALVQVHDEQTVARTTAESDRATAVG
ncbi:MAG: HEAT repeat domain-containing protein [Anaerolineae bacterium]|nr:HEAT repeat domain-containing protein [Anaerolineae bacterium]